MVIYTTITIYKVTNKKNGVDKMKIIKIRNESKSRDLDYICMCCGNFVKYVVKISDKDLLNTTMYICLKCINPKVRK